MLKTLLTLRHDKPDFEQAFWIVAASHRLSKRQLAWLPADDQALVTHFRKVRLATSFAKGYEVTPKALMQELGRDDDCLLGNPLPVLGEGTPWEPSDVPRPHRLVYLMHHCQLFFAARAELDDDPESVDEGPGAGPC